MQIYYLFNSGFAVFLEAQKTLLVFDDYRDPEKVVEPLIHQAEHVYFFISHAHFDHFDTHIVRYADVPEVRTYIASNDIRRTRRARQLPPEKTVYIKHYETYQDDCILVESYDSTDIGTSFRVTIDGIHIFHAGDFNWWHWKGDTEENNKLARNGFMKQMKRLDDLAVDIAFFPVDGRLEEFASNGAKEFCARTKTKALVTMHNVVCAPFVLPEDFFSEGREIPVWVPVNPGEMRYYDAGGFHT